MTHGLVQGGLRSRHSLLHAVPEVQDSALHQFRVVVVQNFIHEVTRTFDEFARILTLAASLDFLCVGNAFKRMRLTHMAAQGLGAIELPNAELALELLRLCGWVLCRFGGFGWL